MKILTLVILLVLGGGYLSPVDRAEPTNSDGVRSLYADASTVDSLKRALEGGAVPTVNARISHNWSA